MVSFSFNSNQKGEVWSLKVKKTQDNKIVNKNNSFGDVNSNVTIPRKSSSFGADAIPILSDTNGIHNTEIRYMDDCSFAIDKVAYMDKKILHYVFVNVICSPIGYKVSGSLDNENIKKKDVDWGSWKTLYQQSSWSC